MCGCQESLKDNTQDTTNYKITNNKEISENKLGKWVTEHPVVGGIAVLGVLGTITYKLHQSKKGELL